MRPTIRPTRIGFLTAIGGFALVLAACSSSGASTAPSAAAPSAAPPASAAPAASGGAVVIATANGAVGDYLTGTDGKTLYIFTKDSANKSVCEGDCATTWPPVIITGDPPAVPAGVTGALTTFARADGSMQLALNGSPLYYYTPDTKAGDTTGEGVGGVWFVARPDGSLPSPAASSAIGY